MRVDERAAALAELSEEEMADEAPVAAAKAAMLEGVGGGAARCAAEAVREPVLLSSERTRCCVLARTDCEWLTKARSERTSVVALPPSPVWPTRKSAGDTAA